MHRMTLTPSSATCAPAQDAASPIVAVEPEPESSGGIPERLGRYHVLGLAGRGNMGVVYTGYDPYEERDVAIKVCRPMAGADARSQALIRRMFYNEAHTAGVLDHPNILRILDAGEHGDELYIVMEYVEGGGTLERHTNASRLLPVKKVAEIAYTCARALDYAHRQGVVHRDIKPTNILFTPDGDLKIGDFGIAERSFAETTHVLGIVGTPHFMSPEAVSEEKLTGQTDLYSLGVLMFQLLTAKLPFEGATLASLLQDICHGEPTPLQSLRPDIPEALAQVVEFAMQRDLARRYATGRELASDLAAIFGELETGDETVDQDERFRRARELRFFSEFDDAQLWEVLRTGLWEIHEAGSEILTEGTLDMSLFVIVAGEVEVLRRKRVIGELHAGDCFGEMGLAGQNRRTATIRARRDVTLLKVSTSAMELLSTECQLQFHKAFVSILVERLSGGQ